MSTTDRIPPDRQRRGRPNILWICSDQQRWDTLGCYGNPWVHTPHLDQLAAVGVRCAHAFAQNPLCSPSRACFLTGRYPTTNRLRQNGQLCPPDLRILPRMLADQGYVNGLIGKLHLNPCDRRFTLGERWWEIDRRFHYVPIETRIDDGYHEFYWDHAASANFSASDYQRWVHERGGTIAHPPRSDSAIVKQGMPDALHQTRWCADRAISFIERHADEHQPWLLSVNIFDPHPHFDPEPSFLERYLERLDDIPLPAWEAGENARKPAHHQQPHPPESLSPRDLRLMKAAYWAMCDHIDHHVGRMLAALDQSGQRERTIVIYTSDHGELLGDHGKLPKGPFLYDCALRVPLIWHWPGHWEGGHTLDGLVELTDIAPSLASVCALPDTDRRTMQGWDLGPWLSRERDGACIRDDVYAEYPNSQPHPREAQIFQTMVRTATHKLIHVHGSGEGELYDLTTDPGEHRNLWHDPVHAQRKLELLLRLSDRHARTCDPQPERIGIF